jgi:hypothetical protein
MSNEAEFSGPAHSMLMKTVAVTSIWFEDKNRTRSIQASPQAAKKKRYSKVDIVALLIVRPASENIGREAQAPNQVKPKSPTRDTNKTPGSIGQSAAWLKLIYD